MIDAAFSDWISMRRLGPGRILFACSQIVSALALWEASDAPPQGDEVEAVAKLRARIQGASESAEAATRIDRERQSRLALPAAVKVPALRPTDALADRLLGSAHRTAKQSQLDFTPDHPRHVAASAFLNRVFPKGVRAIIHATAFEQLGLMRAILADGEEPALRAHIQTLGLSDMFERLAEVTRDYALALQPIPSKPTISGAQVLDALRDANGHLCRVVAVTLGHLDGDDQAARREALLAPIKRQHDAAYRAQRGRGVEVDIDPTTGEDLPDPAPTT
jgi:hypothetical protein